MSGAISSQKKFVEQLRVECNVNRIPCSESIVAIIQFTEQNKDQDPLIIGIDKKTNPFSEQSRCAIL